MGQVSINKHWIHLPPVQENPVHCASYRAGPTEQEYEKSEIEKILEMKVFEPAETEWAAAIVYALQNGSLL